MRHISLFLLEEKKKDFGFSELKVLLNCLKNKCWSDMTLDQVTGCCTKA